MPAATAPRRVPVWIADLALAGVTLIWGLTFSVVKSSLRYASPLWFNAARLALAALLLFALYGRHPRRIAGATWAGGALLGLFLASGYALQTVGLASTPASTSAFLTGLSVVLVPLFAALAWRRRLGVQAWISAGLALGGLYLLVGAGGGGSGMHRGEWLTLGCAGCFALHIAAQGELAPRHSFRELAALQIGFAAAFTGLLAWRIEIPVWHSSPGLYGALALTAVLATALAFTTQAWAQQFTPANHTAVVFSLEPVFAWLAAALWWHERLRPVQLLGALFILAAIVAVESGASAAPPSGG